ncbi:MAG: hypothetical protein A2992_00585 [Elusimicrobia bacterium RIFCSPLOWO2_01_FULL_59_12]|nr:MAG: hypothetical protein A2992_00585 [Elusimicrobia bacterium RIFCSPLOWO2_01_FULL_59_12]
MVSHFKDPAVLIPIGTILVGIAFFFWAMGKLFKKTTPSEGGLDEFAAPPEGDGLFNPSSSESSESYPPFAAPTPPPTAIGKEMADRLDGMSQKLNDMQSVLQRQSTMTAAGAPLTPETIDKLLKIIGNVTQQVDLLQRSLGASPGPQAKASPAPAPASAPTPVSSHTSSPSGLSSSKGGVGVLGGALSRSSKQAAPPAKTPPAADAPPTAPPPGTGPAK